MAKIGEKEKKVTLHLEDGDAGLTLRQPSNEEINEYHLALYDINGEGKEQMAERIRVRSEFFDKLITGVENLEDEEGNALDSEGCKRVLRSLSKAAISQKLFEDGGLRFSVKN